MLTDSQVQGQARIASIATEVSSPGSPLSGLVRSVLALDWKLLVRALQREGRQNLLVAFLGAALLLNLTSSAGELGRVVRAHPFQSGNVLTVIAWIACCTVFAFCFLSGHLAVGRRISDVLRTSGRTHMEMALTVAARHLAGRQAAVCLVVLIPVVAFLNAWLGLPAAFPFITALFLLCLMFSSAAAVTRYLPRAWRILAGTSFLALVPPAWFALHARSHPAAMIPLTLSVASMIAAEATLSIRYENSDNTAAPIFAGRPVTRSLYGRELVLALRSGRLLGFWLFGIGLFIALGTRVAADGPLLPLLALSLLPLLLLSAFFSNLFGPDGAGFQCHWTLPVSLGDVMAAKERTLWTLALVSLLIGWASMLVAATQPPRTHLAGFIICAALAYALWIAAAGRIISILFPRGADPRRISGDYLSPAATLATGLASTVFLAVAGGVSMLYDRGRITDHALLAIGGALVLLTVIARLSLARAAAILVRHRREEILKSVLP